ncbi:MBL fold metallo-hydrolase RNA specificity domain-containing protein [Chloroflexota bacterium]
MNLKLHFLGAAQNVTGSRYCLDTGKTKLLVDCGLFQERDYRDRNWDPFPIQPSSLDCVVLTHAHLDHSGLLPKLVREGFRGSIFCTEATADLVRIMLTDSAKIQEEDAASKRKRHEREGRSGPYPEMPLYTEDDATACFSLLAPAPYGEPVEISNDVAVTFHDAGHVLGSSMISIVVRRQGETRTLVFSGDIGRWNKPILRDPSLFDEADYVVVESTYGDRLHEDLESVDDQLIERIRSTIRDRGNIIVPSFALERSQEVLFYLNKLLIERRIPNLMVFLDSPMAVRITDVFEKYPDLYDQEMSRLVEGGNSPFDFPGLTLVRTKNQSKAINSITGSAVIIAGSGMCTGGRIKHHLVSNISRPECTILFVGYQASGTLGRIILDGASEVRILGEDYLVRAKVTQINGLSAHADRGELLRWLLGFRRPPRQVFAVHGEPETVFRFADLIREKTGWEVSVPGYQTKAVLD